MAAAKVTSMNRLIRMPEVERRVGFKKSKIYDLCRQSAAAIPRTDQARPILGVGPVRGREFYRRSDTSPGATPSHDRKVAEGAP